MTDERETLTYELFGTVSRDLASGSCRRGERPADAKPASLQGPAASMRAVGGRDVLSVEFYTGIDQRLDLPVVLPPTLDRVDITGSRVLVADDVADTGKTLELVRDFCAGYVAEVRTAVIYEKPHSVVSCDYGKDLHAPHGSQARRGALQAGQRSDRPAH